MDIYWQGGIKGLDELAERLGIGEAEGSCLLRVSGVSGRRYDVIAIAHAILDRMDESTPGD